MSEPRDQDQPPIVDPAMVGREQRHGDGPRVPGSQAGEQVGLGRIVEDRRAVGAPDPGDPGAERADEEVAEASEASFPASDPPMWRDVSATPHDPGRRAEDIQRRDDEPGA
jgi:hypothetical protein